MTIRKAYKFILISVFSLVFMSSCSSELESESSEYSLATVKIKGSESQLSKLNVEVLDVQFKVLEDDNDPNAWVSVNTINTGIHDLTNLTGEQALTLVDFEEITSGFVYSIKIVLGDQNMAIMNGVQYELDVSLDFQDASTNIIGKQLKANALYEFTVEFEIDKSVVISSNGSVDFQPTISTLMRRFDIH